MFLSQNPEILILVFFLKCVQLPGRKGFASGSVVKNPLADTGDGSSIPRSGRSPGGGHGNPL